MSSTMPKVERVQRRPAVSCNFCRKRKIRCDRKTPCNNCIRRKQVSCVYEGQINLQPEHHARGQLPASRPAHGHFTSANNPVVSMQETLPNNVPVMSRHPAQRSDEHSKPIGPSIRCAEGPEDQGSIPPAETTADTVEPNPFGGPESQLKAYVVSRDARVSQVVYKNRVFGRSHWLIGAYSLEHLFKAMESVFRNDGSSTAIGLKRCKALARTIKSARSPPWPLPPTTAMPTKDVSDKLVGCYMQMIESIYRILHIPTFQRSYNSLWVADDEPSMTFRIQLKLVHAIGAAGLDDEFSLRRYAIQWVYEAQTWLAEPIFKSRLSLEYLQIVLLFLLAREATGVGDELVWISAGSALRLAVLLGLHRDPRHLPRKSLVFSAEMRRRLWNTVLEFELQTSMSSGTPVYISLDDFDTTPPSNFDDDQLEIADSVPRGEKEETQTFMAIKLRQTFPIRLAIAKFLNNNQSDASYTDALLLDAEFRAASKALSQDLRACDPNTIKPLDQFARRMIDITMARSRLALHTPFFSPNMQDALYTFSKKVAGEMALKLWSIISPDSFLTTSTVRGTAEIPTGDYLVRLMICSPGFSRNTAYQASYMIAAEISAQLRADESISCPMPLQSDLLVVLETAKALMLRSLEAGETNVKNYLLMCVASAEIESLIKRQSIAEDELQEVLTRAAGTAVFSCVSILENYAGRDQHGAAEIGGKRHEMVDMTDMANMWDWDFSFFESPSDFGYG